MRLLQRIQSFLPRLQGSILLSPIILVGVLSAALLGFGQVREILLRVAESESSLQLLLGFVAMALLSATLFFGYLSACVVLRKAGIGYGSSLFYNTPDELKSDFRIVCVRDSLALVCAALPLLAIGCAFDLLFQDVEKTQSIIQEAARLASPPDTPGYLVNVDLLTSLRLAAIMWWILSLVFLVFLMLYAFVERRGSGIGWRPARTFRPSVIGWIAAVMLVVPIPLLNIAPVAHDEIFQTLGPLATMGLVLTSLTFLLFYVGEWSRKSGFPIFVVIAIVVFGIGAYRWSVEKPRAVLSDQTRSEQVDNKVILIAKFTTWLKKRKDKSHFRNANIESQNTKPPYPVFIVAAPGGGIYAADFAATVMARLQDKCEGFAQHVFAISAVSGGAIGSTIFHAMSRSGGQTSGTDCAQHSQSGNRREEFVKQIMSGDHLSSTLATTVPDVIVKLLQIFSYEVQRIYRSLVNKFYKPSISDINGRVEALEISFREAMKRTCSDARDTGSGLCQEEDGTSPLDVRFDKHWQVDGAAPALVLNTTWAETGDRTAFSPFRLDGVGDATLKSREDLEFHGKPATLVQAAVASARFPAVLPAKIHNPKGTEEQKLWWNFVDGGYADASGTTTALEIYQVLYKARKDIKEATGIAVDLRLLILTDASGDTDSKRPTGDGLIHTISPITTLLNIRQQIGRRATERAVKEIQFSRSTDSNDNGKLDAGICAENNWGVKRIFLDSDGFELPMGWMLSRETTDLIELLAGAPVGSTRKTEIPEELKRKVKAAAKLSDEEKDKLRKIQVANVIHKNSQTMHAIKMLLSGECSPKK